MIRGIITSVVEGVIKRFTASGRQGETFTSREYMQHYGYTSRPLAGAEAVIINEGNHIMMIASDDRRYRIGIEAGEVCIYTDEGDHVRFKRGMEIYVKSGNKLVAEIENEINATTKTAILNATTKCDVTSPLVTITASTKVSMVTPLVEISGRLSVGQGISAGVGGAGDIIANGDVRDSVRTMAADREIYNSHTHNDPQGGTVGVPNQQE